MTTEVQDDDLVIDYRLHTKLLGLLICNVNTDMLMNYSVIKVQIILLNT